MKYNISDEVAAYARLYGELIFCVPFYNHPQNRTFDSRTQILHSHSEDVGILKANPSIVKAWRNL